MISNKVIPLQSHTIKKNVIYLTKEEKEFSSLYLNVRSKETRILSDKEVSLLPYVSKNNPNKTEWLLRQKTRNRFIDYIKTKSDISILDVGCGNGWFSNTITLNNNEVLGLDINSLELEQAARVFKKEKLAFVYGNLFKINEPFINKFDLIVLNASIQYFSDVNELVTKLKTFLKPSGEIHIIDSPFYSKKESIEAKKRTEKYYHQLGFPEMADNYFHHTIGSIKDFKVLYRPKSSLYHRFFEKKDSPFLWLHYRYESEKANIRKGFSNISHDYEMLDKTSGLILWMRNKVRTHFASTLNEKDNILEINSGSGIDAVFFAKNGYRVHATDVAEGMVNYVKSKIVSKDLQEYLTCEMLSFNNLDKLKNRHYNRIFSNFGGLNCSPIDELETVFYSFKEILKPQGSVTLVIMPRICLWEFFKIFKGNSTAFRRLNKNGVLANIKGEKVRTYYHSARKIKTMLEADFENFKIENISFLGPTGNRNDFCERHPFIFKILSSFDTISNKIPFLRGYGDYYILTAERK